MRSTIPRIILAMTIIWSVLPGMDFHEMVKVAVQLAHAEHHLVDHHASVENFLRCLVHTADDEDPTAQDDHERHHDHSAPTNTGTCCTVHVAVPPGIFVLQPHSGDGHSLAFSRRTSLYPQRPLASIFQPPRA